MILLKIAFAYLNAIGIIAFAYLIAIGIVVGLCEASHRLYLAHYQHTTSHWKDRCSIYVTSIGVAGVCVFFTLLLNNVSADKTCPA